MGIFGKLMRGPEREPDDGGYDVEEHAKELAEIHWANRVRDQTMRGESDYINATRHRRWAVRRHTERAEGADRKGR